ncbi:MAG: hypothetical protein HXY45_09195 [Syntrophaceae bacterium]|nr:hypothetical protein [Syntrophaceae bacterium]
MAGIWKGGFFTCCLLGGMMLFVLSSHAQSSGGEIPGSPILMCRISPGAGDFSSSENQSSYLIDLPGRPQPDALAFPWGEPIQKWKDLVWVDHSGELEVYRKEGGLPFFGPILPERLYYAFWRGLFYAQLVQTLGRANWNELKEMIFELFGEKVPRVQLECPNELYVWHGSRTRMVLDYCHSTREGSLLFFSVQLDEEMRKK